MFKQIFKASSKTYFYSSLFFPRQVQEQVSRLYAFVRLADDFVDNIPQQKNEFEAFAGAYFLLKNQGKTRFSELENQPEDWLNFLGQREILVLESFLALEKEVGFDPAWTESFLRSMRWDLEGKKYEVLEDTVAYIYGSANVIGLYMCKILGLRAESYLAGEKLGMAFQYINFIRDIAEDLELGRSYFPDQELAKFGLESLKKEEVLASKDSKERFFLLIKSLLHQYQTWQQEAQNGFHFLPIKYRVAIQTASDMYAWTGQQIAKNPFLVYEKKLKPGKFFIISRGLQNYLKLSLQSLLPNLESNPKLLK